MTTDAVPGPITPIPPAPPMAPPFDAWGAIWRWTRILLARNPFYIISAVLLLWSMRQLSLDSRIFPDELPQLLFNFSSFQFYELLLAGTAILLARRRIWYDSGLLVGLENLFICVPFLLVSQALAIAKPGRLCLVPGRLRPRPAAGRRAETLAPATATCPPPSSGPGRCSSASTSPGPSLSGFCTRTYRFQFGMAGVWP
jgi:hypothetical protein